ncbi:Antigenic thaumatin protein [Rutstroemia sp. NJR-2017a BBW]|nr:Antigenic thaumatin protein [Rutstroemia sp. NJR-2017a BBW]PQE08586.1 Antigenic thaumatin protein [Rutstroemia sp. NJR-2017a BBW]
MHYSYALAALAVLASTASASLTINNWCSSDVYIFQSTGGSCDKGTNGLCSTDKNATPWHIKAGNGASSTLTLPFGTDGKGTSIKIAKVSNWSTQPPVLQFEYSWTVGQYAGLYWDLSDLDGSGSGLVGSPFTQDNVKISPTGAGTGSGSCLVLKCPSGALCKDAYNVPDQTATRSCPLNTGTMWIDLCEPKATFKRNDVAIGFQA